MKSHYNFYLIIFYFHLDLIQAFAFNFSKIKEKISINETSILFNDLPFQKEINNTLFNCTSLEVLSTTLESNQESLLCLKDKTLYILSKIGKILLKKDFNNNIANKKRNLNDNNQIKCSKSDLISSKNFLCIECNTEQGYYPIINNYNPNAKYKDCFIYDIKKQENNLLGYYLDSQEMSYKKCHENCLTCKEPGNDLINNCILCKLGYIKQPEITPTTNCVKKCDYYYYYTLTGDYICTNNFYCSNEASNLIKTKNKCINNCSIDDIYKKQYNGECYELCPNNTKYDNNKDICIDININICTLTIKEIKVDIFNLNFAVINTIIKNYANEFYYTFNHITQYISEFNYSIVIYRNKSCLDEFKLNSSKIFFESCLNEIKKIYNISYPIIVIIDRIGKYNHPSSYFAFYNPDNGEKLDTTFCENSTYTIKKNISNLYLKDKYDWLVTQGVDIFDMYNSFYTSHCFLYKNNYKKDIAFKDRLFIYYPNISLCGFQCEYKKTDYVALITECKCLYKENDLILFDYTLNAIADESTNTIQNLYVTRLSMPLLFYETYKITFLFCFKNAFNPKLFIRNIGGIIILILLIIEIVCVIILIKSGFFHKIINFLRLITEAYLNYLHKKKKEKKNDYNNIETSNNITKKENLDKKSVYFKTAPKEEKLIKKEKENSINYRISLISLEDYKNSRDIMLKNNMIAKEEKSRNKHLKKASTIKDLLRHKSLLTKINENEEIDNKKDKNINIFNIKNKITEEEAKNYFIDLPEEMDYYDSLEKDKRSFCEMILGLIIKKNIIVNTFFISEETEPLTIKMFEFVLFLLINFVSTAALIFVDDITMLYNMSIAKYLYKTIFTKAVEYFAIINLRKLLRLLLIDKGSIREIIKREKKNKKKMKEEIDKLIKWIKLRYSLFIILNLILVIGSMYFIITFNNAYPNVKIVWIILSIIIIFLMQIIYALLAILSICLRFISLRCTFNFIFVLSQYLYDLL